eukprot:TRINITY_DN19802_c0_g1_i1.p1 TRINITY_DN19802_c0_g1~~TRINITY_DN19802_c0_g1_i1.p1  ORF type:complete len:226 (+),score=37.36 TRINITY_DN19802_c0_g1_i1:61-738(+)
MPKPSEHASPVVDAEEELERVGSLPSVRSTDCIPMPEVSEPPPPPRRSMQQCWMGLTVAGAAIACGVGLMLLMRIQISEDSPLMHSREFGTCPHPVAEPLRWNADPALANRIACHNRRYAEQPAYWELVLAGFPFDDNTTTVFYDSVSRRPLFRFPVRRTWAEFRRESQRHGWPSFRSDEVYWEDVVVLRDGEVVSIDGTHLGHDLPDARGSRYCINIVSIAGRP